MDNNDKPTISSGSTKGSEDQARSILERWVDEEEDIVAYILGDDKDGADK